MCESEEINIIPWSLSNVEINEYMKNINGYLGCFAKDMIPPKLKKNKAYICNFQNSNESGSHWVCCINKKNVLYYFDSYGVVPIVEIQNTKDKYNKILYNSYQIQPMDNVSVTCGFYCMFFVHEMLNNNKDFIDLVYEFGGDKEKNDDFIFEWFQRTFSVKD